MMRCGQVKGMGPMVNNALNKKVSSKLSDFYFYVAALNMGVLLITFSFTVIALLIDGEFASRVFICGVVAFVLAKIFWFLGEKEHKRLTK